MSARCFGGGSGGGTGSLMFGMGIGTETVDGEEREEVKLGRCEPRYRSEVIESWTWIWGRAIGLVPR
jgi:hypothetical protein